MVIWFIGKSAAGKTYIGKKLYDALSVNYANIVFLDGDQLRNAISKDLSHSKKDRYISEERRSRLSKILSDQGIHVIMCGISNVPQIRDWNKKNIMDYIETQKTEGNFFVTAINKFRKNNNNTDGILELIVLSYLIYYPIVVYDNYNNVKYIFSNGLVKVNDKTIKKYLDKSDQNKTIYLKFDYEGTNTIPRKIYSIYYKV